MSRLNKSTCERIRVCRRHYSFTQAMPTVAPRPTTIPRRIIELGNSQSHHRIMALKSPHCGKQNSSGMQTYQTTSMIASQSLGLVGLIRLMLRDGRFHETYKMREHRSLPGEYGNQMRSVWFHHPRFDVISKRSPVTDVSDGRIEHVQQVR